MQLALQRYGFTKIGQWRLSHHKSVKHLSNLPGITFEIQPSKRNVKDVIYAFEANGIIIYVGETSGELKERFGAYRYGNPLESDTDNRIKKAITEYLQAQKSVEIWVLIPPKVDIQLEGIKITVPTSKPIEEYLIAHLAPPLNKKNLQQSTA